MTQPESGMAAQRTAIAFERTALAVLVGVVVVARLNLNRLALPTVIALCLTTVAAVLGAVTAWRRARRPMGHGLSASAAIRSGLVASAVTGLGLSELLATFS